MDNSPEVRLLILTDMHYVPAGCEQNSPVNRLCQMGLELTERAIRGAMMQGGFDVILLLGDIIDDGTKSYAAQAFGEMRELIKKLCPDVPFLIVPGNHDGPAEAMLAAFDQRTGVFEICDYRFVVFADNYEKQPSGDLAARLDKDRKLLREIATKPGGPIVALQHSPLYPEIPSDGYPYMLANFREVRTDYADVGVLLSLSGHYHAGQPISDDNGVKFFTSATLTESPFAYSIATLKGREVSIESNQLVMAEIPPVFDCHAHTEFAYCATDVTADGVVNRSKLMGLSGVCLSEHCPQLYISGEDFWAGLHVHEPKLWRENPTGRMAEFRKVVEELRSNFVYIGLEVEVDREGCMILREEDRDWPDILVGAVHWLMERADGLSEAEIPQIFLKTCEALLAEGVDILAHPWRYFHRKNLPTPKELYPALADMLAETNTAVEINFHTNLPDPSFFAECIRRGVKISLGSDSHAIYEVGMFAPHLAVLRTAACTDEVSHLLFAPDRNNR